MMFRLFALSFLVLLAACAGEDREVTPNAAQSQSSSTAADVEPGATETDAEPAATETEPAAAESTTPAGGTPNFQAQEGWLAEKPSSDMRSAQFRLPGVAGGPDAEVVVFFFDGGGGDVESNFLRWEGQFRSPAGDPVMGLTSEFMLKGRRVDLIELEGKYSGMAGSGGEGMAMIGAIAESEYGPYFIRLLGPEAAVEAWRKSYTTFLHQLY